MERTCCSTQSRLKAMTKAGTYSRRPTQPAETEHCIVGRVQLRTSNEEPVPAPKSHTPPPPSKVQARAPHSASTLPPSPPHHALFHPAQCLAPPTPPPTVAATSPPTPTCHVLGYLTLLLALLSQNTFKFDPHCTVPTCAPASVPPSLLAPVSSCPTPPAPSPPPTHHPTPGTTPYFRPRTRIHAPADASSRHHGPTVEERHPDPGDGVRQH